MATEKRLIDAEDFAKHLERMTRTAYPNLFPGLLEAAEYAKDFPTVDAVEVVRCKDCTHAGINENHPNKPLICYRTRMCGTVDPEWYCWDGEAALMNAGLIEHSNDPAADVLFTSFAELMEKNGYIQTEEESADG